MTETTYGERREHRRYNISLELTFRQITGKRTVSAGGGRVVDISSGGVSFYTNEPPPVGSTLELTIRWPYCNESGWPLALLITGRVVRSFNGTVAVKMSRYEFHASEHLAGEFDMAGGLAALLRLPKV
jgi:hypothetical protein